MSLPPTVLNRAAWPIVLGSLSGLAGGWIAMGGVGLLGHSLRHAFTWLALIGVVIAVAHTMRLSRLSLLVLLAGGGLAIAMTSSSLVTVNILAATVLLCAVAFTQSPEHRRVILLAAETVLLLALSFFCRTAIPISWQVADIASASLGGAIGAAVGRPLSVGASFAGVDVLLAMLYIAVVVPVRFDRTVTATKRVQRMVGGVALVLSGHAIYLCILAYASDVVAALPAGESPMSFDAHFAPPDTESIDVVRHVVPWHLPVVAILIHTVIAGVLLVWASGRGGETCIRRNSSKSARSWRRWVWRLLPNAAFVLLCVATPLLVAPSSQPRSLHGKKIVLYEQGYLNWLRPQHGEYGRWAIGMYGILPTFLEHLGAEVTISSDLAEDELHNADALVLIYPNEPWQAGQRERIWDFVRRGGSLLVMGEHTTRESDGGNRFNEILEPTAMRVRFDSATFAIGGWLQSYQPLWHSTSCGIRDLENDFGVVIGASIDARLPARPLLAGRWGWADPGDEASESAMMGNGRYDAGERLGDVLLAAEQPFGEGKIIVFGDTSNLSNGITIGCHAYTSRLFAYLADDLAQPVARWRQWLALTAATMATVLLIFSRGATSWPWSSCETRVAGFRDPAVLYCGAALAISAVLAVCTARSQQAGQILPNGRYSPSNKLAYVDASHLEAYSRESWREDGTMGLCLALMREGYLTLTLPELSAERLQGARILISIAPARPFTKRERAAILQFVRDGGIFISTVGYQRWEPSRPLLEELGFRVGAAVWCGDVPIGGPEPLGHFKAPYFDGGDYLAYVRYHAGWPVCCDDPQALVVSYYPEEKPLIVVRRYGQGLVAVIGDTCFAMNKNLELESGEPIEGLRENADFWRWFLTLLGEDEAWYPPPPP